MNNTHAAIGAVLLFSSHVVAQDLDALAGRVRAGNIDAVLELGRSTDPRAKDVLRLLQAEASARGHSLGWPLVKALARQGERRALLRIAEDALFDPSLRIQALE